MKRARLLAGLALLALALTACAQRPTPEPVTITIEMTEYAFTPSEIELQVGQQVTFILENTGQLDHEMMVGQNVHYTGSEPDGYNVDFWHMGGVTPDVMGGGMLMQHDEEGAGEMEGHDMSGMESPAAEEPLMVFQPMGSDSTTVTFTVTPEMVGEWEIGCFELNGVHYTAGMVGTLVVTP
ncbi:MAG: cupredoxin domain-containing protein [Chloroflexi bacterium]|nr:cupredoxin domain-containing protein [Chloroflexota bacterium]